MSFYGAHSWDFLYGGSIFRRLLGRAWLDVPIVRPSARPCPRSACDRLFVRGSDSLILRSTVRPTDRPLASRVLPSVRPSTTPREQLVDEMNSQIDSDGLGGQLWIRTEALSSSS